MPAAATGIVATDVLAGRLRYAASGHEWTDNEMRGVFKTTDAVCGWLRRAVLGVSIMRSWRRMLLTA